jgi:histidinol phosphatase-like PHP family hydrolase
MRFVIDHDYHIHSNISPCASDPEQTPEGILRYAEKNGLKQICLTDHFWDEAVTPALGYLSGTYRGIGFDRISSVLPLPQSEQTAFHFGCEGEMDLSFRIGLSPEIVKKMEFIIVPTTHMHMPKLTVPEHLTLEQRAILYVHRLNALIESDMPSGKTGIAHLTCSLMAPKERGDHLRVLEMIPDTVLYDLFRRVEKKNYGVELNFSPGIYTPEELQTVLRPYFIAKECGCKFYLGSDAHTQKECGKAPENFERMVDCLNLTEEQKFRPFA